VYDTIALSGTIPDQQGGFGTLAFFSGFSIQNGAPDGLALVDDTTTIAQFLSYEGTFDATDGSALDMTSTEIPVTEGSSTPVGGSLQLTGTGSTSTAIRSSDHDPIEGRFRFRPFHFPWWWWF